MGLKGRSVTFNRIIFFLRRGLKEEQGSGAWLGDTGLGLTRGRLCLDQPERIRREGGSKGVREREKEKKR